MRKNAAEILLTQKQKEILEKMAKATHGALHFKIRAQVILLASEGMSNRRISSELEINRSVATKWRSRWGKRSKQLEQAELESPQKLFEKVKEMLTDDYRSGKPPNFTPEQVACIIDLSLQTPESVGVPITHWSINALRDKAIDMKIVESISSRQVGRFLKRRPI